MKILVVAPHGDDEVLGVGGTIARYASEGAEIYVVIVAQGFPPDYQDEERIQDQKEALAAHKILGVKETIFLSFPAARLDTIPHRNVNKQIFDVIKKFQPDILFVPFVGDIHIDHQRVFLSSLVAARPNSPFTPKTIYAYETLSETNWNAPYLAPNFVPNTFIDISAYLETKLEAMQAYASQIKRFPDERSEETIRALATVRGSTVNRYAAEAFYSIRQIF
ncbi:MAG: PIG-L family deacetylase [Calothrix sp. C42_A2020_038]|nr:PIG-L family deacetylase [Calothrix sp. C42_A2020_038]